LEAQTATASESAQLLRRQTDRWTEDPVAFVLGTYRCDPEGAPVRIDAPQAQILRAVAEHDRVAVRSAHGIGKTTCASWLTHWWLATRMPALVVTMAGTWGHLEDKLWPEVNQWGRLWRLRDAFEWQQMGIYSKANPDGWRAVASASDEPENIEGFHNPNVLVIVDEAKSVPDEVWAAIRGALTQTSRGGSRPKVAVFSTPPLVKVGWYVDLFGSKASGWKTIHVSAHESSRVSKDWIEEMRVDFGEDSAVYQSKVGGDIPEGAAEAVVQIRWFEAAQLVEEVKDRKGTAVSCDVAREGEDLTTFGRIRNGRFDVTEWKAVNDTMWAAGACKRRVIEDKARILVVDDTGVGGGVTDRCLEMQREETFPKDCRIVGVKFGASAPAKGRFHSTKDQLWWMTRDALKNGLLALPSDSDLAALQLPRSSDLKSQVCAAIYEEDSQSRIRVLDKRETNAEKTKALPTKSPDLAHALILAVLGWRNLLEDKEPEPATTTTEILRRLRVEQIERQRHGGLRRGAYRRAR